MGMRFGRQGMGAGWFESSWERITRGSLPLANPCDEDLAYLGVGLNHPNEVCFYPDSGKALARSLRAMGYLREGEPDMPRIFDLIKRVGPPRPAQPCRPARGGWIQRARFCLRIFTQRTSAWPTASGDSGTSASRPSPWR